MRKEKEKKRRKKRKDERTRKGSGEARFPPPYDVMDPPTPKAASHWRSSGRRPISGRCRCVDAGRATRGSAGPWKPNRSKPKTSRKTKEKRQNTRSRSFTSLAAFLKANTKWAEEAKKKGATVCSFSASSFLGEQKKNKTTTDEA